MAKNDLWDFDQTAGNNTDVGGQSTQGSALVSTIDSIVQKFMAVLAGFAAKLGGTGTVGGTADAITLTTSATWPISSLVNGMIVSFKASAANTGAATINVDSKGAKAIRRQGDSALSANDIVSGGIYQLRYDTAYNSAAGAWVLLNPTVSSSLTAATTTDALTGTDASKYLTADAVAALWEKGADVASASTISLAEGGLFHVTGTTPITDIDWATAKNGRGAWVVFDGILTLTHNATTLKLPSAANITTAAGDRAYFVQDSSDNVVCMFYQRADGTALVAASGSSGQPVPTSSTYAVDTLALCYVNTGSVANGNTISGSALRLACLSGSGGAPASMEIGGSQSGTWTNVSGVTIGSSGARTGYFVRTA